MNLVQDPTVAVYTVYCKTLVKTIQFIKKCLLFWNCLLFLPLNQDIDGLRTKRNNICDLVGVAQPKLIASKKPKTKAKPVEQFDSYSDLVGRAGY